MENSRRCPIKISYIEENLEKPHMENEIKCTSNNSSIDCSNGSEKDKNISFWIFLNIAQTFIILSLLFLIVVKLCIQKHCVQVDATCVKKKVKNVKKVETLSDDYKPPRPWDALALPEPQICRKNKVESLIYEDVGPINNKPISSASSAQCAMWMEQMSMMTLIYRASAMAST